MEKIDDVTMRIHIAKSMAANFRLQPALSVLDAIQGDAANIELFSLRARLLTILGRFDDAIQAWARVLAIEPENPDAVAGLATIERIQSSWWLRLRVRLARNIEIVIAGAVCFSVLGLLCAWLLLHFASLRHTEHQGNLLNHVLEKSEQAVRQELSFKVAQQQAVNQSIIEQLKLLEELITAISATLQQESLEVVEPANTAIKLTDAYNGFLPRLTSIIANQTLLVRLQHELERSIPIVLSNQETIIAVQQELADLRNIEANQTLHRELERSIPIVLSNQETLSAMRQDLAGLCATAANITLHLSDLDNRIASANSGIEDRLGHLQISTSTIRNEIDGLAERIHASEAIITEFQDPIELLHGAERRRQRNIFRRTVRWLFEPRKDDYEASSD
jgi:tetratricopeptide (TPR) repeat protein